MAGLLWLLQVVLCLISITVVVAVYSGWVGQGWEGGECAVRCCRQHCPELARWALPHCTAAGRLQPCAPFHSQWLLLCIQVGLGRGGEEASVQCDAAANVALNLPDGPSLTALQQVGCSFMSCSAVVYSAVVLAVYSGWVGEGGGEGKCDRCGGCCHLCPECPRWTLPHCTAAGGRAVSQSNSVVLFGGLVSGRRRGMGLSRMMWGARWLLPECLRRASRDSFP